MSALYGTFAIYMAGLEGLSIFGLAKEAPLRTASLTFVFHALAGGIGLIGAPLQLNGRLRRRARRAHRAVGLVYVGAIAVSSLTALRLAASFDVSLAAKASFSALSVLWLGTTVVGLIRIVQGNIARHQEWMTRSVSLTLFFITFSLWVPGLEATSLPQPVAYPLAVSLSWGLNLLVAEFWIRSSRAERRSGKSDPPKPRVRLEAVTAPVSATQLAARFTEIATRQQQPLAWKIPPRPRVDPETIHGSRAGM